MTRQHAFNPTSYLILTSLLLLLLTLMPTPGTQGDRVGKANLLPLRNHRQELLSLVNLSRTASPANVLEMVGNVGMFLPFGALASMVLDRGNRRARSRILLTFAAGLIFSALIETAQLWLPTRYTDIDDVIFNSSGALLGALLLPAARIGLGRLSYQWQSLATLLRARRLAGVPVLLRRR